MISPVTASALLLALFMGTSTIASVWAQQVESAGNSSTATLTVRVMSFNIHHGADKTEKDRLDEMAQVILDSKACLVGLQEVDIGCNRSGNVDQMKRLAELTNMHPVYAEHIPYDGGSYGLGLLSKYPLTDIKNDRLTLMKKDGTTDTRALLSATTKLPDGRLVTMATVHMALDQPSRMTQAAEIIEFLGGKNMPVLLTGDLNAEPGTDEIRLLETVFKDTDVSDKLTFPVDVPVKKIDYIFIDADHLEEVISHQVLTSQIQSDQLAVISDVQLSYCK